MTLQHLKKGVIDTAEAKWNETLTIYDGKTFFYMFKNFPNNFLFICQRIFKMMYRKWDVVFSTDTYVLDSV